MGRGKLNLLAKKIRELYEEFPETKKLFSQISLPVISEEMSLEEFFYSLSVQFFRDSGLTKDSVLLLIENIVNESKNQKNDFNYHLESLKVSGGFDKDGKKEDFTLDFRPGDIYAVTGLTGSGKTQLSGGQSRALMISDIALISDSPVVLIDEPENAGIDKDKILNLLSSKGKIVLVSTHDPIIALSCPKRIVIKNGAVSSILEQTDKEKNLLAELKKYDENMTEARNLIREGKNVC